MRTIVLLMLACTAGCATLPAPRPAAPAGFKQDVELRGSSLTLHLTPARSGTSPLIFYATGDGGWRDNDKRIFHTLSTWGYPVVGVGAPQYIDQLGEVEDAPRPANIADDFAKVVSDAEAALGLPDSTPVVFVGVSRGAGLAVAASYASQLDGRLLGVLAISLTHEEENALEPAEDGDDDAQLVPLDTYAALPSLGSMRVAIIQSTRDEYVPAEMARELLGPDSDSRRLRAIEANHSFDGAAAELDREMKRSFQWIVGRI